MLVLLILVVAIIFVFLRNLRATIIPGLAIPTSIIATFAVMAFRQILGPPQRRHDG